MKKLTEIMASYLNDTPRDAAAPRALLSEGFTCVTPINPKANLWRVVDSPERLMRRFEFSSKQQLASFVGEVFEYEVEVGHSSKLTIDELHVDVEIYTRTIDRITELDFEYSKMLDQIFDDVGCYAYEY